jgi:large subunit ribosomal protein L13
MDNGDFVVIINAEKVALTGSATTYAELLEKSPEKAVEKAIRGMLPKNTLGRDQLSKLKVYRGAEHPHVAQAPKPYTIGQVAQ